MDKLEQEQELEKLHYQKNDEVHKEYRGKPEFNKKMDELDKRFREEFRKIFKQEETPST